MKGQKIIENQRINFKFKSMKLKKDFFLRGFGS